MVSLTDHRRLYASVIPIHLESPEPVITNTCFSNIYLYCLCADVTVFAAVGSANAVVVTMSAYGVVASVSIGL